MSDFVWGKRKPGDRTTIVDDDMLIIGEPDVVRLPPELGGGTRKVLDIFESNCPKCFSATRTRDLGENLFVAECTKCNQFFWYSRK